MRETSFIGQNKDKWVEFEQNLKLKRKDPEKLSKLFVQITDDLSYSRTFYPNRSVRVYLNGLAQQVFQNLYKNRRTNLTRVKQFWTDELPHIIYNTRKAFFLSFLLFWVAFTIGVLSSKYDPKFSRLILGDSYVEMTLKNIKKGDPLGVYKGDNQVDMFLGITLNNLLVSFITFLLGLLASIGTVLQMLRNGIMVGTFQYFFIERGLFWQSFLTIWIHGTLEISTIIISGAAGMVLGSGLVFPGTYSRLQAFRLSARKAMKIMIGVTPIVITAGFLEGFVTRYTGAPTVVRLGIILLSLFFIIGYYVIYPWRKSKSGFDSSLAQESLPPTNDSPLDLGKVRNEGDIFTDLFQLYKPYLGSLFAIGTLFTALYTIIFYFTVAKHSNFTFNTSGYGLSSITHYFSDLAVFFSPWGSYAGFPLLVAFFFVSSSSSLTTIKMYANKRDKGFFKGWMQVLKKSGLSLLVVNSLLCALLFLPWKIVFILAYPFSVLWMVIIVTEESNLFTSFTHMKIGFMQLVILTFLLGLVSSLLMIVVGSPLAWIVFGFLQMNFRINSHSFTTLYTLFFTFTSILGLFVIRPIAIYGLGLYYFSQREIKEANGLRMRIRTVGTKRKLYGLEQEM